MKVSNRETNTIRVNKTFDLLIKKLEQEVNANLHNEQFGVEDLADKIGMSRSNLHRKLQQATGQSVSQFIREYRLHRALECLENDAKTISEVAHEVGFGSPAHGLSPDSPQRPRFYGTTPGFSPSRHNRRPHRGLSPDRPLPFLV